MVGTSSDGPDGPSSVPVIVAHPEGLRLHGPAPGHRGGTMVARSVHCGGSMMLFWWCALAVVLAAVYMVTYTLLRTSGDGRPWYRRLRHPDRR